MKKEDAKEHWLSCCALSDKTMDYGPDFVSGNDANGKVSLWTLALGNTWAGKPIRLHFAGNANVEVSLTIFWRWQMRLGATSTLAHR